MASICVFAGTTEGREIVRFLAGQDVKVTACVTTAYGETLLPEGDNIKVSTKKLPPDEIRAMLLEEKTDLVIDATHPYAVSITESIYGVCSELGVSHVRLLRGASEDVGSAVCFDTPEEAVAFLSEKEGNILLTTGSKDLAKYAEIKGAGDRVYARVLPVASSIEACEKAGIAPSHIIALQGPFSQAMNESMIEFINASWMVTKDGGNAGGFEEKIMAAEKMGARVVLIGRPEQRSGISLSETIDLLCEKYGCTFTPEVKVVGIGPGAKGHMTGDVLRACEEAQCLIGAKRMLEAVASPKQTLCDAISPKAIADYIMSHRELSKFTVVMSGDAGFFSGTKKLLPLLEGCSVSVYPGISSMSYLSAKSGVSYDDMNIVSLHGRDVDIAGEVAANEKTFALVGGQEGMKNLCLTLKNAGLGSVKVTVGERLSYEDEIITSGTASELSELEFDTLSVAIIENENPKQVVTHGMADEEFQRNEEGKPLVPMTKMEVRSICLSKLQLTKNAVCWDVGAGTGSVAIEMAMQAKKGKVFAIEKKEGALELLNINKEKFGVTNMEVIPGSAPMACADLEAPTHVFVGGSSGNMKEILELALSKNPEVRVVATAITLESIGELVACTKDFDFKETEAVAINVARSKKAGAYNLMMGQNPIYIFTMQGR